MGTALTTTLLAAEGGGAFHLDPSAATGVASLAWLVPLLPLLGFAVLILSGRRLGEPTSGWLATATVAGSFVVSLAIFLQLLGADARTVIASGFDWITVGELELSTDLLLDPLSVTMMLVVTGVGALIHVYSVGYMHGDARFQRYFAYLNLFVFSMLILVMGSNYVVMFVGWELVGLCSYLLIGFWFEDIGNAVAAKKAMIVNRIGDISFAIGLFLIFAEFGSLTFSEVLPAASDVLGQGGSATIIALLLLGGATGKSAQIPLYVWLPDAMAGPTPVSALIHAATMVTAGVYMVARTSPIYALSETAMLVTAGIGVATALLAALIALQQDDIKKVLAYSTISQLGYMFVGVGVGAFAAGMFHLITHAFFKALLFLAAGSVMHAMADRTDMWRMGGLRQAMPITFATAAVAWLAISGIPPLSGFFSKDHILTAAYEQGHTLIWFTGLITAALTAFYMSRWLFVTFLGDARWREGERAETQHGPTELHPHESPANMWVPLAALAVLSAVGGLLNPTHGGPLDRWLEPVVAHVPEPETHGALSEPVLIVLAAVAGLLGIVAAWAIYLRRSPDRDPLIDGLAGISTLFRRRFYVDEMYEAVFVRGGGIGSRFLVWFDETVIDGAVHGVARSTGWGAGRVRRSQVGPVRGYVAGLAVGAVVLIGLFMIQVL